MKLIALVVLWQVMLVEAKIWRIWGNILKYSHSTCLNNIPDILYATLHVVSPGGCLYEKCVAREREMCEAEQTTGGNQRVASGSG